jgi:hypothetical protein
MDSFDKILATRFQENQLTKIHFEGEQFFLINLVKERGVNILMTSNFYLYQMPVPEKLTGYEFGQLYFCVPEYWSLTDTENPDVKWMYEWLAKVQKYTTDNFTWLGDGHTYNCAKHVNQLSSKIKQNHLFLSTPIFLERELTPIQLVGKTIHFFGVIPIFSDEMDYKQGKGTVKLKKKFLLKGVTEKLDEFRQSCLRNRWLFFK